MSPYAIAKQYAHAMTAFYRRGYGLHASNGILCNHESPRREVNFATRKITATLARIARGADELLLLGWEPTVVLDRLVEIMMESDLALA